MAQRPPVLAVPPEKQRPKGLPWLSEKTEQVPRFVLPESSAPAQEPQASWQKFRKQEGGERVASHSSESWHWL